MSLTTWTVSEAVAHMAELEDCWRSRQLLLEHSSFFRSDEVQDSEIPTVTYDGLGS